MRVIFELFWIYFGVEKSLKMATIKKFEELEIWNLSRSLASLVFDFTQKKEFSRDFGLKDQINRSSGSTMDNIAEGFGRGGKAEFIHFLSISKASNCEVQSQLYRAKDRSYLTQKEFNYAFDISIKISVKISNFMNYLKSTSIKGSKFKRN